MQVQLFKVNNGPCPYLEGKTWISHVFSSPRFSESLYEEMIGSGWRRSGTSFYQNHCPDCSACTPIRIPSSRFLPSKSQRRVARKNTATVIKRSPTEMDEEVYRLYKKYSRLQHQRNDDEAEEEFLHFLGSSPMTTDMMRYYIDGKLAGAGWIDILPNGLSSIYFAFDPDYAQYSLGTYSIMKEIELCRMMGKPWLFLGFFVAECAKMSYKGRFKPYQLLTDGRWKEYRK
jgi:arginine-tRNA-protein transferase